MLLTGHLLLPSFSSFTRSAAVTARLEKNSDSAPRIFDDMDVLAVGGRKGKGEKVKLFKLLERRVQKNEDKPHGPIV